jgi:hypothetical protein
MNTGIQDGVNLGWKLAFVILGKCSCELLSTYHEERKMVGEKLINFTSRAQKISSSRNQLFNFIRNNALKLLTSSELITDIISNELGETAYQYCSSISIEHWESPPIFPYLFRRREQNILRLTNTSRLKSGHRIHPEMIKDNFLLKTNGFKAILFEGLKNKSNTFKEINDLKKFGQNLVDVNGLFTDFIVISQSDIKTYDIFGVKAQCIFLIRPDGHIGLRSEPIDIDIINGYMKNRIFSKIENNQIFSPKESLDFIPFLFIFTIMFALLFKLKFYNK